MSSAKLKVLRACAGKRRYWPWSRAEAARVWCEAKRGVQLRLYFCEYCGGYHLTKTPLPTLPTLPNVSVLTCSVCGKEWPGLTKRTRRFCLCGGRLKMEVRDDPR